MEFNEAFTIMQGVNRSNRASVRLEEVLKVAADAERAVSFASTRKAVLEKEVTALATNAGTLRAEMEELEGAVVALREQAARYKEEKKAEALEFFEELEAKRGAAVAKVQAGVEEAEKEARVEKSRIAGENDAVKAEKDEVNRALQTARAELAALQKRVGGLG